MIGTAFEVRALRQILMGRVTTYSDVANKIHARQRAVGAAIGKNPIAWCPAIASSAGAAT
jgi:O6-methylguanine-DNA--protein-cysteine methyltransferase